MRRPNLDTIDRHCSATSSHNCRHLGRCEFSRQKQSLLREHPLRTRSTCSTGVRQASCHESQPKSGNFLISASCNVKTNKNIDISYINLEGCSKCSSSVPQQGSLDDNDRKVGWRSSPARITYWWPPTSSVPHKPCKSTSSTPSPTCHAMRTDLHFRAMHKLGNYARIPAAMCLRLPRMWSVKGTNAEHNETVGQQVQT
ncbi:hypothetical protein AUEXF2481DRAFT_327325 [Aureobasidium subglaciale EXF-2481]|uniref:Uncharacterized protein n=1 Tax=Aureobasidium subglaciale (strain EXF-2481) TaxID=1043005 RepID=A0A074Y731_AURSE|nr:uncharacterized protein AUEXF2481DRAFT_327325 [Aureobasidium subglaciale EXF-2481]KEQ93583.1 hypothetical protein AUEXF2481DRAFT_327325 [Aureobasidium subglaciale EXF-2481]